MLRFSLAGLFKDSIGGNLSGYPDSGLGGSALIFAFNLDMNRIKAIGHGLNPILNRGALESEIIPLGETRFLQSVDDPALHVHNSKAYPHGGSGSVMVEFQNRVYAGTNRIRINSEGLNTKQVIRHHLESELTRG